MHLTHMLNSLISYIVIIISFMTTLTAYSQDSQTYDKTEKNIFYRVNSSTHVNTMNHELEISGIPRELDRSLQIVAPYTRWNRTFNTGNQMGGTAKIAHMLNLKMALGVWQGHGHNAAWHNRPTNSQFPN